MTTAVWMACVVIGGLLAGVACAVAILGTTMFALAAGAA